MLLVGIGLIAIAVVTFMIVKARDGAPKLGGKPLLENAAALAITIAGATGVVITFIGMARL